jgi:hypothetical protein
MDPPPHLKTPTNRIRYPWQLKKEEIQNMLKLSPSTRSRTVNKHQYYGSQIHVDSHSLWTAYDWWCAYTAASNRHENSLLLSSQPHVLTPIHTALTYAKPVWRLCVYVCIMHSRMYACLYVWICTYVHKGLRKIFHEKIHKLFSPNISNQVRMDERYM